MCFCVRYLVYSVAASIGSWTADFIIQKVIDKNQLAESES